MASSLVLNPQTRTQPPYQRVMEAVIQGIQDGLYRPGDRLPSLKEMGRQLSVHFLTVRKAMLELSRQGVVEMHVGVGTFVRTCPSPRKPARRKILRLAAVYSDLLTRHMRGSHPAPAVWIDGLNRRQDASESTVQIHCYRDGRFFEDVGQTLLDSQVDGAIQMGTSKFQHCYQFCKEHEIPLVEVSSPPESHDGAIVVKKDTAEAMRQAMDYLRSLGHQRIAYIGYKHVPKAEESLKVFMRLADADRPNRLCSAVTLNNHSGVVSWADADRFFEIDPRPSAVIVQDEYLAEHMIHECLKRGLDIPGRLSLLAIQDLWPLRTGIDLTTLFTYEAMRDGVSLAADLLVKRIRGETVASRHILPPQIMLGDSTGPFPGTANPSARPDWSETKGRFSRDLSGVDETDRRVGGPKN